MATLIKALIDDEDPWITKRLAIPFNPDKFPEFMPPEYEFSSVLDMMYKPSGSTRFENYLATIAREEFVACLLEDARVTPHFQAWMSRIGVPGIADDIADYLDRVAQRRGLASRGDLARVLPAPLTLIQDLLPEGHRLKDRLYIAYERGNEVLEAACDYVRNDLGQQWRWLAYRLTYHLLLQQWEHAVGLTMHMDWPGYMRWLLSDPPLQPVSATIHWEAGLGESNAAVEKRVIAELRRELAKRRPIKMRGWDLKIGRVRPDSEQNMPRYTRWLYKDLTSKGIRYQLAQSYHDERQDCPGDFPSCPCQQNVHYGITRALEILNNTSSPFTEK
jgi:hypothetical protein